MKGTDPVRLRLNGEPREVVVADHATLLETLRDTFELTGTKRGCDDASCGACTVLVDGEARLSCITLAQLVAGRSVTTIEGAAADQGLNVLQEEFRAAGGLQCGFCTPGMVLAAGAHLRRGGGCGDAEIRRGLAGNLCRCTGYGPIVAAVSNAARRLRGAGERVP